MTRSRLSWASTSTQSLIPCADATRTRPGDCRYPPATDARRDDRDDDGRAPELLPPSPKHRDQAGFRGVRGCEPKYPTAVHSAKPSRTSLASSKSASALRRSESARALACSVSTRRRSASARRQSHAVASKPIERASTRPAASAQTADCASPTGSLVPRGRPDGSRPACHPGTAGGRPGRHRRPGIAGTGRPPGI